MPNDSELFPEIAKLLNLPEDSEAESILEALRHILERAETPDPRKYAPVEALQDAIYNNAEVAAQVKRERVKRKVQDAFSQGYLTGAGKQWALELCLADEAAFDRFIEVSVPQFADLATPLTKPTQLIHENASHASAETAMLSEQLGIDPSRFNRD